MSLSTPSTLACMLLAVMLLTAGCRKEKSTGPSDLDQNYFVIEDNPNDPIDHSIYEFYKSTGIASFYNDTIYKRKVSKENEYPERYTYVTLSLEYMPLENIWTYHVPLSSREKIPALLDLMKTDVVPKLPDVRLFPSILLIDSFINYINTNIQVSHGWTTLYGFNTLGLVVKDVEAMSSADRKMYAASILAGIAEKRVNKVTGTRVQNEFLSVSREASKNLFPFEVDIYYGIPFIYLIPPDQIPPPNDIGFLFYPTFDMGGFLVDNMLRETDDIRAYLTAVFYYTEQEFADLHPNQTLLLKKFNSMRSFAKEAGFKIPE
ncbi:hypothetical protein [Pseudobacter ginsenosidimutans]|uniref:Lipoprotein n=1 Tax=Pseudobacter ginsenosidimutans TaxID=661488 RepID=A0A4Q7N1Y4_9BACT|nr:hypothetical protein [Pseudobacter ginsenosidimutans]QEC43832.1 hypothetical protein FSB84_19905 [Pseudobacter ginsenosidimutans]RZS75252.1 hypothetical protein EV199_1115 [Pseudobacter ginsenosidimutans]